MAHACDEGISSQQRCVEEVWPIFFCTNRWDGLKLMEKAVGTRLKFSNLPLPSTKKIIADLMSANEKYSHGSHCVLFCKKGAACRRRC